MMIVFANDQAFDKALANYNKVISAGQGFSNLASTSIILILNPLMRKDLLMLSKRSLMIIKI